MALSDRQGVESLLATADTYLQTGNPDRAQELLIKAKLGVEGLNLDDLVDPIKTSLAVSHLDQANDHYNAGRLAEADAKYPEAEHAYAEFAESFEGQILLEHMGNLYNSWVSSTFQLGKNAHIEGGKQLSSAAGDAEIVLAALGLWDTAIEWYAITIHVHDKAKSRGVNIDSTFKTIAEDGIATIKNAAVGWCNSIGRPADAEKYLP